MKKCLICGKAYESSAPHSKYCSLECGYKAKTMQRKQFQTNNPKYMTEYMRKYRENRPEKLDSSGK